MSTFRNLSYALLFLSVLSLVMIIPFSGFASAGAAAVNLICIAVGIVLALLLDHFNSKVEVK